MDNQYFSELNGYKVKDKDARDLMNRKFNDVYKVNYLSSGNEYGDGTSHWLGDSIVITGNKNGIIDFGSNTDCEYLINFLNDKGITKIDFIVISHFHRDHVGGNGAVGFIDFLDENYDFSDCIVYLPHKNIVWESLTGIENLQYIIDNQNTIINELNTRYINYKYCDNEEIAEIDTNLQLKFLNTNVDYTDYYTCVTNWNLATLDFAVYNNFSMVVEMKHHDNYFLFTGDIEPLAQSKVYPYIKHCDVLKVEHHGLNYITDSNYLKQLSPKYAVIGELDNLDSQLLARQTVSNLLDKGTKIYATSTSHNVEITSSYNKIEATAENGTMSLLRSSYNLYDGQTISKNTNLNDIEEVGAYNSPSASFSASYTNTPITDTGFKLIVEKMTNTGRLRQTLLQSNSPHPVIWARNFYNDSWGAWEKFQPSLNMSCSGSDVVTSTYDISLNTPTDSNRFILKNDIFFLNLDILVNEAINSYTYFIDLPTVIMNGNIPVEVPINSDNNTNFALYSDNGTVYPMYINYANNKNQIRTRKAIPSGTNLRGSVAFMKRGIKTDLYVESEG